MFSTFIWIIVRKMHCFTLNATNSDFCNSRDKSRFCYTVEKLFDKTGNSAGKVQQVLFNINCLDCDKKRRIREYIAFNFDYFDCVYLLNILRFS